MSESLLDEQRQKRKHLEELEVFLKGEVYKGWQSARKAALTQVEEDIIENPLTTREYELALYKDKGKRELLLDLENQFEDVRVTLKDRLDELDELLQPNSPQQ